MLHQIGAGSLGPVFRGEDPATRSPVAIKSLRVDLPPERSRQVADALKGLPARLPAHPSVIAPIDAGLADLVPYVVWPLFEGTSLDVALREFGPAACVDALPRLAALADALDRAAKHGVWHGALHPRDIMVADDETWMIGLGVAPILERSGIRLPARRPYTAPEQLEGHATSPHSDQFALAAIAHEWLFGRRVAGPANESLSVPQLPGVDRTRMTDAFSAGLAIDPAARFMAAAEFVRALEASVIDQHEAKLEGMARAARRQAKPPAPVPLLPLEGGDEADSVAAGEPEALDRFATLDHDDDPLDRLTSARSEPPVVSLDSDDGLFLAAEHLETGDAVDHDEARDAGNDPVDAGVPRAGGTLAGSALAVPGGVEDGPLEDDEVAGEFPEEEPAVRATPAVAPAPAGVLAATGVEGSRFLGRADDSPEEAPVAESGDDRMFADSRGSSGGAFGAGTVVAALFVGIAIGLAAGYGLALRQPATMAVADREARPAAGTASGEMAADVPAGEPGQPYTDGALSPAPPAAAPAPAAADAPVAGSSAAAPAPAGAGELPGRLLVRSTPAGAQVRVDGELRGVTPLALRDLPLATHSVIVTREGFQGSEHRVALTEARPSRSLDVSLARPAAAARPAAPVPAAPRPAAAATSGSLLVESRPAGAVVRLDDREVGTTPLTVPALAPGNYRVTIARDGYQAWTTTVRVVAGERARVAASLVGGRLEE